jgi:biotin carboxyl carrier protein
MADASAGGFAALKLRIEVNGEAYTLDLQLNGGQSAYILRGAATELAGEASIEEISPGIFSVLAHNRSVLVQVAPHADGVEVWAGLNRYVISLADPRDKAIASAKAGAKGPVELRAQMPGKIIKLLAEPGAAIKAGQGLLVVEAMKMQNEVKSPKDGTVGKIYVDEGGTVAAGDLLMVVV